MGQNYSHMNTRSRWTLLCEASDKWEAYFIQGRLQSAGIAVHVVTELLAELYGITHGTAASAKIYVPESDVVAAREVLASEPGLELDADEDSGNGTRLDTHADPADEP